MQREKPMACVVCGCAEDNACDGGCSWAQINPPICSRCASAQPFELEDHQITGPGPEGPMGERRAIYGVENWPNPLVRMLNEAYAMGRRAGIATMDLSAMQRCGHQMANVCFNLGQFHHQKGMKVEQATLKTMYDLDRQWRDATAAHHAAENKALGIPRKSRGKATDNWQLATSN